MIHFQAPDGNGTESVSVCEDGKQHEVGELTRKWFQVSPGDTSPHSECDLCQFDEGRMSSRLSYFYSHGLLKRKGNQAE